MAMSGVELAEDCMCLFQEMKTGHKHKYAVFRLSDDKKNVVEECHGGTTSPDPVPYDDAKEQWEAFTTEHLKDQEPRFAVYDVEFVNVDGGKKANLLYILWNPDDAPIKKKMVYSATNDAVKKKFDLSNYLQANGRDDLLFEDMLPKAGGKDILRLKK